MSGTVVASAVVSLVVFEGLVWGMALVISVITSLLPWNTEPVLFLQSLKLWLHLAAVAPVASTIGWQAMIAWLCLVVLAFLITGVYVFAFMMPNDLPVRSAVVYTLRIIAFSSVPIALWIGVLQASHTLAEGISRALVVGDAFPFWLVFAIAQIGVAVLFVGSCFRGFAVNAR